MNIPDCYDPICQEEQRQAEWDKFAETLPECVICRRKIMPGENYHVAYLMPVCRGCRDELDDNVEYVEAECP